MKKLFFPLLLTIFLTSKAIGQEKIDTGYFATLQNKAAYQYKLHGELLGCKMRAECRSVSIVFYSINIDRQNSRLFLSGRVLETGFRDSVGAVGVNILLAQAVKNQLTKAREVVETAAGSGNPTTLEFPARSGDFLIDLKFSKNDRLLFDGELYTPVAFDIGKLLRSKEKK